MLFILLQLTVNALAGVGHAGMTGITGLILRYGYLAIFILLILESASIPIPSEIIFPAVGYFAANGDLNLGIALLVALAGSIVGMAIDYYLAYFFEKKIVYKHLKLFHVTAAQLKNFDKWFSKNGPFAVFVCRLLPVLRGIINFPAGFAKMPIFKFYAYSLPGVIVWEAALTAFGYYALRGNVDVIFVAIAAFVIVIYALYRVAKSKMR